MFIVRVWCFFIGCVYVKIEGKSLEKFINLATANRIFLWDIQKRGNILYFKVTLHSFFFLKSLVRKTHCYKLKILKKVGFPFLYRKLRSRKAFLIGGVIFCVSLYILSTMVWFVEITGRGRYDESAIRKYADKLGVHPGAWKRNLSQDEIAEAIKNHFSDLSWVGVSIHGTKVDIQIVPRTIIKRQDSGPCDVVAKRDGVIEQILVLVGEGAVQPGDTVLPGQILIHGVVPKNPALTEGTVETENAREYEYLHARGIVKARCWYEGYGECNLKKVEKIYTGKIYKRVILCINDKKIILKGRGRVPFSQYEERRTVKGLPKWRNFSFPVEINIIEFRQYKEKDRYISRSQAVRESAQKVERILRKQIPAGGEIRNRHVEVLPFDESGVVRIKLTLEVVEEIGENKALSGHETREENVY